MKSFFVLHNDFSYLENRNFFLDNNANICGILVHGKEYNNKTDWVEAANDIKLWTFVDFKNETPMVPLSSKLEFVIAEVVDDHRFQKLAERQFRRKSTYTEKTLTGPYGWEFCATSLILKAISIIESTKPDQIICQTVPHGFYTWVFARTAEALEIPVISLKASVFPWRHYAGIGIDEQRPALFELKNETVSGATLDYIELQRKEYLEAIPDYEFRRIESYGKSLWSLSGEIKLIPKNPIYWLHHLNESVHKYRALKELRKCIDSSAVDRFQQEKVVTFFLHYQPERTSLPEGYEYAQQYRAILFLRSVLPDHVAIAVKEHPSVFRRQFNHWVRNEGFYKEIANIENVFWVNPEHESFDLIDKSVMTATLTGTVGFQSICRDTPALVLGAANFKNFPGVILKEELIERSFETLVEDKRTEIGRESIVEAARRLESVTVDGSGKEADAFFECLSKVLDRKNTENG